MKSAAEIEALAAATDSRRDWANEPKNVDSHMPFSYYGLDSIDAVVLAAELQEWLGAPVSADADLGVPDRQRRRAVPRRDTRLRTGRGRADYRALLAELEAPPER